MAPAMGGPRVQDVHRDHVGGTVPLRGPEASMTDTAKMKEKAAAHATSVVLAARSRDDHSRRDQQGSSGMSGSVFASTSVFRSGCLCCGSVRILHCVSPAYKGIISERISSLAALTKRWLSRERT